MESGAGRDAVFNGPNGRGVEIRPHSISEQLLLCGERFGIGRGGGGVSNKDYVFRVASTSYPP